MSNETDPFTYDMPWRPNYEMKAIIAWSIALVTCFGVSFLTDMPDGPFLWMTAICVVMILLRTSGALRLKNLQKNLSGRPLEYISLEELNENIKDKTEDLWLGYGFEWETRHAQRTFEILKRDWSILKKYMPKQNNTSAYDLGQPWIHGVEPNENKVYQPLKHTDGHTLICGTTGSGKTRMFDLFISQAVLRNECCIIYDPKGDKEMRDNAKRACLHLGQPERFASFHPAFPETSVRLDPLRNFTRVTEIASRLAALIPSEAGADPFKSFAWQALNNIAQGLVMTYERPNLVILRRFLEGGAEGLVINAVKAHSQRHVSNWEVLIDEYMKKPLKTKAQKARAMLQFYRDKIQPIAPSSELEGLISMYEHDSTHFGKMVANLLPIMNMLTSGELGKMLSPDPEDLSDDRPIFDTKKIINNGMIAYIGLDSLTDGMVGSAIGSIFLSDLTAVAGDRYNFGVDNRIVNIFIDEAAEIINEPFIQILNKGRGARLRLFVATQTFADFEARMGNKAKSLQVLGNINNIICLRVKDNETQQYITDNLPKTRIKSVLRTQGINTSGEQPIMHGGSQGERLMEEEGDLFSPGLLGVLPNFEYFANISGGKIIKGRIPFLS